MAIPTPDGPPKATDTTKGQTMRNDTKNLKQEMSKVERSITIEKAHRLSKNTTWKHSTDFRPWLPDYFTTAQHRIQKVRWEQEVKALNLKGNYWDELVYEKDDMKVTITMKQDEYADTSWLGSFSDDEGDIVNPNWSYRSSESYKYFTEANTSVAELTEHYNGRLGMPKHDARLAAIKSIELSAKEAAGGDDFCQYGIIVKVEIDGTYIGEDSLWGTVINSEEDVWGIVSEHGMIEEAIGELDTKINSTTERLNKLQAIHERLNRPQTSGSK